MKRVINQDRTDTRSEEPRRNVAARDPTPLPTARAAVGGGLGRRGRGPGFASFRFSISSSRFDRFEFWFNFKETFLRRIPLKTTFMRTLEVPLEDSLEDRLYEDF